MPSMRGIRTSISTTSGRARGTSSSASRPSAGLADHRQRRLRLEDHAQPLADHRLVVDQDDADHDASPAVTAGAVAVGVDGDAGIGSLALTRQPPPGRGPAVNVPPAAVTRSRIPSSP